MTHARTCVTSKQRETKHANAVEVLWSNLAKVWVVDTSGSCYWHTTHELRRIHSCTHSDAMNQNERNINCYKATSNIICLRRQSPSAMQCNDLLLRPGTGAEYCDQLVCLSVCPRAYLWNRWTDLRVIFVQIPCGRGSVLLWRRCDTLCTSGFMDDVTFRRSGPMAMRGRLAALRYRGGVWCLWIACLIPVQGRLTPPLCMGHQPPNLTRWSKFTLFGLNVEAWSYSLAISTILSYVLFT